MKSVADPGFAKGGGGRPWRARLNGGLSKPRGLKAFCTFLHKKWPKVKDFSENLPPCLSHAAMTSPEFWSMGGGRPDRP